MIYSSNYRTKTGHGYLDDIIFTISMNETYSSNENIIIFASFTNTGESNITMRTPVFRTYALSMNFIIEFDNGTVIELSEGFTPGIDYGSITLHPGDVYYVNSTIYNLDNPDREWYDYKEKINYHFISDDLHAGTYSVQGRYTHADGTLFSEVTIFSNEIEFKLQ